MLRALFDVVLPTRCASCETPGEWLCKACEASFPHLGAACARCAEPTVMPIQACGRCRRDPPPFSAAFSAARYTGFARDALIAFKLGGERRAARAMAHRMIDAAPTLRADVLTFVPATARSMRERGFNPAEELARAVGRLAGVPCVPLLRKVAETADQAGLSRTDRVRNVETAFAPSGRAAQGSIVIVDDVMTTGATARACARVLDAMGRIAILTFARAG